MKKTTILMLVMLVVFADKALSQEQGTFRVGAGLALGTKSGADENGTKAGLGINAGAEYFFTDKITLAPSYTMFFKSTIGDVDSKLSSINIDARYYFKTDGMQIYGLAGFASLKAKVEASGFSVSSSESGLNIGAGAIFPLGDSMGVNTQVKYQTPGDGQIVANVGLVFAF